MVSVQSRKASCMQAVRVASASNAAAAGVMPAGSRPANRASAAMPENRTRPAKSPFMLGYPRLLVVEVEHHDIEGAVSSTRRFIEVSLGALIAQKRPRPSAGDDGSRTYFRRNGDARPA